MGLITKAIEKVETKETPLITPQESRTPLSTSKPKSKKRFILLLAALMFLVIAVGLAYLFLIKPASETPPAVNPRSISARKKSLKPAQSKLPALADTVVAKTNEKTEITPEKTTLLPGIQPTSNKETKADTNPNQNPVGLKIKPSAKTVPGPSAQNRAELIYPKRLQEPTSMPELSLSPETEKEIPEEVIPSEDKQKVLPEDDLLPLVSPESKQISPKETNPDVPLGSSKKASTVEVPPITKASGLEKTSTKDIDLSPLAESKIRTVPKPLGVIDRSASRAEKYYHRGFSYHQEGDFAQAIDSYKRALAYDPNHMKTHMNLATAYMQTGRYREAERELTYLYAVKPKDPKILYNFGLLLYQTGELTSAETKLKKLLEYDPFDLEANLLLASIYEEKGDLNQAAEFCMKAYQINSTDPQVLYRLGRTFDLCGDRENSIKYYRLFLEHTTDKDEKSRSEVRERLNFLLLPKEGK